MLLAGLIDFGPQSAPAQSIMHMVTDNRRHFLSALRHGMRVETPAEFLAGLKKPGK